MHPRAARLPLPVALALALCASCRPEPPVAVLHGAGGPARVRLEIAATPAARARGLMYRTELADGDGMLFVFEESADHAFWMKNTFVPLDLLFIGDDLTVVGIAAGAVPQSTRSLAAGRPSRWVLEVPGGWAARHGVAVGARVDLPGAAAPGRR